MIKTLAIVALTTGIVSISCSSAFAAGPGFCREYAHQAVISAAQNRGMGCGFRGLRWTPDYNEHFGWCLSASPDIAMSERMTRAQSIRACRGG